MDQLIQQSVNNKKSQKSYDNGIELGNQFINWFYTTWITNPDLFLQDNLIKPYTKIKHNGITYTNTDFILFLKSVSSDGLNFSDCVYEIIDSGSRQIYILVTGKILNNQSIGTFSQSFVISFAGNSNNNQKSWTLVNSIFILH